MSATILTSKEFYSENTTLHTLNVDDSLQFKKGHFIGKYSHSCVSIIITLKFFRVKKPQTKLKIIGYYYEN